MGVANLVSSPTFRVTNLTWQREEISKWKKADAENLYSKIDRYCQLPKSTETKRKMTCSLKAKSSSLYRIIVRYQSI